MAKRLYFIFNSLLFLNATGLIFIFTLALPATIFAQVDLKLWYNEPPKYGQKLYQWVMAG
jgi:hypothetical protein